MMRAVVITQPRSRGSADIYFHLPKGYDVLGPQEVTLNWSLRVGTSEYRQTTRFQRASGASFHDPFLQTPLRGT